MKGPELLNMYMGNQRANVRRVFQELVMQNHVLFSLMNWIQWHRKEGNQGDSGVLWIELYLNY